MPLKDDKETENTVVKNEDIHENDVLMGRGGKNNRHVGNEKLRDIARGQVEKYKVSTKKVKSAISRDIVKQVRTKDPPGRFLKRVPETGEWEDVGDYLAREKVAQVLRDAVCEAAEAMRPSIHPAMYSNVHPPPYMHYPTPDGTAAVAGVFRQHPMPGMEPLALDDEARRSTMPGLIAASTSTSSSFGTHPAAAAAAAAGYAMPPPWHPYAAHHPHQQPYPGMLPVSAAAAAAGQHPYQPGSYQPHHPAHFAAAAHAAAAYMPHQASTTTPPQHRSSPQGESSVGSTPTTSTQPTPPTRNQGTSSAFGPSYSISLSVAASAAPPLGATPQPRGTDATAYMWQPPSHFATPMQGTSQSTRRKRARSLPPTDKNSPTSEGSSTKSSTTKKTSATQTPTFVADFDPRGGGGGGGGSAAAVARPAAMTSQAAAAAAAAAAPPPPPPLWEHSPQQQPPPGVAYPAAASLERVYFERHSQRYYEQSAYHPTLAQQQQQLPPRSYSAPSSQLMAAATAVGRRGEAGDSDSSGDGSADQPPVTRHPTLSSRKVPKRTPVRLPALPGSFETISPPEEEQQRQEEQQRGGSGTMEPLPMQQEDEDDEDSGRGGRTMEAALPPHHHHHHHSHRPRRHHSPQGGGERSATIGSGGGSSSRRSGRTNPHRPSMGSSHPYGSSGGSGGRAASEAELGLDWFQGELLLESDDDDSQRGNSKEDYHPV